MGNHRGPVLSFYVKKAKIDVDRLGNCSGGFLLYLNISACAFITNVMFTATAYQALNMGQTAVPTHVIILFQEYMTVNCSLQSPRQVIIHIYVIISKYTHYKTFSRIECS